jgi:rpsU-divergently transcribed protein
MPSLDLPEEDAGTPLLRLDKMLQLHFEFVNSSGLKQTWPAALALLAHPLNLPSSLSQLNDISGDLCDAARISPTRLDWYSERLMLASVFVSSEMFFLTDDSEDLKDTR